MLEIGMKAPDFTLQDKDGNQVALSDFAGKKVVLYFYPRDNTPGCTRQACAFAQNYDGFKERGVEVIGISKDSVASHVKFAQKYDLPFILLSDPELQAIQAYGVWQEKKLYGKVSMGVARTTYVIDETGSQDMVQNFMECGNANYCLFLYQGRMYPCGAGAHFRVFNDYYQAGMELTDQDSVDIYKVRGDWELLMELAKPVPMCRYCVMSGRKETFTWGHSKKDKKEWT